MSPYFERFAIAAAVGVVVVTIIIIVVVVFVVVFSASLASFMSRINSSLLIKLLSVA